MSGTDADRFARRDRSRRWARLRPTLIVVGLLLLAGGAVWTVWFSHLLDVESVRVNGTHSLADAAVVEAANVPDGTQLARLDTNVVERRVRSLPPVKSVEVDRSWPQTMEITVQERTAVAALDRDGDYDLVDANGVAFRPVVDRPAGIPVLDLDDAGKDTRRAAAVVADALPEDIARRTQRVEAASADSIQLEWADDVRVFWGSAEQSARKAKVLTALLKQSDEDSDSDGDGVTTYDVSVPHLPTVS